MYETESKIIFKIFFSVWISIPKINQEQKGARVRSDAKIIIFLN